MARRAPGEPGDLAFHVMSTIRDLREERGLENQELIAAADMSPAYYYVRMRGEKAFGLTDVERLAAALGVSVSEVFRRATERAEAAQRADDKNGLELSSRITDLIETGLRADGSAFDWGSLTALGKESGVEVGPAELTELLVQPGRLSGEGRILSLLAAYWDVPPAYFANLSDENAVEMTAATIDFRNTLKETGAQPMASRALGEITPEALRAISRTLRAAHAGGR